MKSPVVILVILASVHVTQAAASQDTVDALINTMRETFGGLNTKRDQWFENYSALKQLSQNDYLQLTQLLFVSKMAIPLVWHLYANQVKVQKAMLPKLLRVRSQALPYHGTILAPAFPIFYVEATLVLHKHRNFQAKILRDSSQEIFHVNFDFENRRVTLGDSNQDGESDERVVLQDDQFPAISLHQPFSVNVQVGDDCIFASIWSGNLNLDVPVPLPAKYHWCTKDYHVGQSFSVSVDYARVSRSTGESLESGEDAEDGQDNNDIQLSAVTIYGGILMQ
ncbi:uncharacterized protein [Procambarus clarkii]|uniref:uncharacterized protein isoform X2 n=1 Tax=Procambarus clarkii TaxID=6728 RepID=UPI003741FDA5